MPRLPWPLPGRRPSLPRDPYAPRPRRRLPRRTTLAGVLVAVIVGVLGWCHQHQTQQPPPPRDAAPARTADLRSARPDPAPATAASVDAIACADGTRIVDPAQVRGIRDTLQRIRTGPPYPYRQDGEGFSNREQRLPKQPRGFYKEFTVETPGSPDRGARRIVVGKDGSAWYTDDHYDSFRRLADPVRIGP